jgi:ERF superfamily
MHRSSESVAAIATALAKAQTELSNPEKAMVGTVYNTRSDIPQKFRYASLSSGLDIVRKALGGQQIAIAQTTDIDRASGTVNLTTLLLHTSGEWISSDWPVCQLAETAAPRRMGAALTYARRYALFTMVGIAGEDDLDSPPDVASDPPEGQTAVDTGLAPNPGPALVPVRANQSQAGNGTKPAVQEKLSAEESAAIRAQLIREIETLPEDGLQSRAIAILKAKNRLAADDAKLVEEAFAVRMGQADAGQEVLTKDEPTPVQAGPTAPLPIPAPTVAVKRPTGRPRKIVTIAVPSAPPTAPSKPTVEDNPPASAHLQADAASAKIQKSELAISEPRRQRDKDHLKFVASHPCLVCGRSPADAHHLRFTQPRAWGRKVSDEFTVPLCRTHHRDNHQSGDEVVWWERRAIDPIAASRMLWISTRGIP